VTNQELENLAEKSPFRQGSEGKDKITPIENLMGVVA